MIAQPVVVRQADLIFNSSELPVVKSLGYRGVIMGLYGQGNLRVKFGDIVKIIPEANVEPEKKPKRKVTVEEVKNLLQTNDEWLYRAILAVYRQQTAQEKQVKEAVERNNMGFNKPDSVTMTYYANWLMKYKALDPYHRERARKKMVKYSKQLVYIAENDL
jgi:hypothetical protein